MNYELRIRNLALFLIILGLILPVLSSAQISPEVKLPGTLEEIKAAGLKALNFLPEVLKEIWQGVLEFCLKVWSWFLNIWNSYIFPFLDNLWHKIQSSFGKEIKERKPVIEEEFQKEKKEMKEEIKIELPKTAKSLWEKFKELIK